MTYDEAMQSCLFRYLSGSHAYGFNSEESDLDYRGVFIAPLRCAFQLFSTKFVGQGTLGQLLKNAAHAIEEGDYAAAKECIRLAQQPDQGDLNFSVGTVKKSDSDEELQELRKFLKLAADCNPNIIEFLYINDTDKTKEGLPLITHITPVWRRIRENRRLFLSKKAKFTFSGYAIQQLKRIEMHRGYLLNPKGKPNRADFDLPLDSKIPAEHQNALLSVPVEYSDQSVREAVHREKKYKQALDEYRAYQKWQIERNPKRAKLEAKCGYDAKHACHLVRLARQAKEILSTGMLQVFRPDWQELVEIRSGNVPYEKIVEEANRLDAELDVLYKQSTLRDKPDHKRIDELYQEICKEFYGITF